VLLAGLKARLADRVARTGLSRACGDIPGSRPDDLGYGAERSTHAHQIRWFATGRGSVPDSGVPRAFPERPPVATELILYMGAQVPPESTARHPASRGSEPPLMRNGPDIRALFLLWIRESGRSIRCAQALERSEPLAAVRR
jgi:hypothetical protein